MTRRATLQDARHGTTAWPVVLTLLLAAWPGPAAAQQTITPVPAYAIAVASDPGAQRAVPALQQAGLQALSVTAPFVVTSYGGGASVSTGPTSDPDQALVQQASNVTRTLEAGLQAMANLELDTAAARFGEVVAMFEGTPALVLSAGTMPFAQALINLGINAFLSGDQGGTEEFFRYAVSIDPTVMPDAELFPDVLTVYSAIVDEIGGRNLVRVNVDVDPEGAEVWIDGVQKGSAPLRVELAPGKHIFVARMAGYASAGVIDEVRAGRRATDVAIALEQAAGGGGSLGGGIQQPQGASELPAALMEGSGREVGLYRSIADQTGARILLVLWLMPGGDTTSMISIQVFDRQTDRVIGSGLSPEVPLDPSRIGAASSEAIRGVLSGPAQQLLSVLQPVVPTTCPEGTYLQLDGTCAPIVEPPPPDDDGSIAEEWWFWTIIGAVVAGGAATGIYFGLTAGGGASGPDEPQVILEF
jgi:hypothetical protein